MAEKKLTKKDKLGMILELEEIKNNEELREFVENEIRLLDKKRTSKKATEAQALNETIKNTILEELDIIGEPVTVTELLNKSVKIKELVGGSNQKTTALLTQLFNDKKVDRVKDKKVSKYVLLTE